MGQRLFGGPRYLFHYFIVSSIVATFAALVWGQTFHELSGCLAFSPASTSVLWRWTPPHSPHKKEQVASSCVRWKNPWCSLLKVLWVLYLLGLPPEPLDIKMHLSLQELTLFGTQEVVLDLRKLNRRAATKPRSKVQGPRSMRMGLLGQLEKTTNRVDLSKCSDLRIILHPNWQTTTPRGDNPLQGLYLWTRFTHISPEAST